MTAPGGHGTQDEVPIPTLSDPADAQDFIDARIAEGADYIKLVLEDGSTFGTPLPTLDEATLRAAIDAAHARGVLAVVHVGHYEFARLAVEAGADGLVHTFLDRMPDPDFGALVADAGVFLVPTLTVLEGVVGIKGGAAIIADSVLGPRLARHEIDNLVLGFPVREGTMLSMANAFAGVRAVHEAGPRLLPTRSD